MRSAWKVRVAGCLPGSRVRTRAPPAPPAARCACSGSVSRARTMARAMRPAKRSSPSVAITWRISSLLARASHAETGWPRVGSMRISSGPSWAKLKPRAASSSCGEETPKSNRMPSHCAPSPCARTQRASCANSPCTRCSRGSCAKRSRPAAIAAGSRSIATSRPAGRAPEDARAVAAATEGRIDVEAGRADRQSRKHLLDKHRRVLIQLPVPRNCQAAALQRQRIELRR